eukprot:2251599-Ditylum_brightwellii.AAC.1
MWLLLSFLLLWKSPAKKKICAQLLDAILTRRMTHWSNKQWYLLVQYYEADVVLKEHSDPYCTPSTDERDLKTVTIALDHFSHNKCSKARQLLCSFGLSDIQDNSVMEQLRAKHPACKEEILEMTLEQMAVPRQGIAPDHLRKATKELSSDVAPDLGSCHNEHIMSILFLDEHDVPLLAKAAVDH